MLKKYSELGHVHRTEPCEEYPGEWMVCHPDWLQTYWNGFCQKIQRNHLNCSEATLEAVRELAGRFMNYLQEAQLEYDPRAITICWKCSDNDPRVGQVWFSGFYQHGKFNWFGEYRSS